MAMNFRIATHRDGKTLHLKLIGDFDGTSAHEFLNVLKTRAGHTSRVFIHTSSLREIHPFGLEVLRANVDALKGHSFELVFTGKNAPRFEPAGSKAVRYRLDKSNTSS